MYFSDRALSFITSRFSASFSSAARVKMKLRVMTVFPIHHRKKDTPVNKICQSLLSGMLSGTKLASLHFFIFLIFSSPGKQWFVTIPGLNFYRCSKRRDPIIMNLQMNMEK
jgi:hypothetical protein